MKYIPRWGEIDKKKTEKIFKEAVPLEREAVVKLPPLPEMELRKFFSELAEKNNIKNLCFLGGGVYDHYIPATVWDLASRREFLTSYTQYQPELSQGFLQALFEYQTMMAEILKMDVVNVSMYDGASALAEAVLMAIRAKRNKKKTILVSGAINPKYKKVLETYLVKAAGLTVKYLPVFEDGTTDFSKIEQLEDKNDVIGVIAQNTNYLGYVEDLNGLAGKVHAKDALFIMSVYPTSLGILKTPGEYGADIAVGDLQPFGIPMSFGGPHAGFFSTNKEYIRNIPGRIIGEGWDTKNKRAYMLTLCTREQHIRRDKATSNICSNQALCVLAASIYLATVGKEGFVEVANQCYQKARYFASRISFLTNFELYSSMPFFNEVLVKTKLSMVSVRRIFEKHGISALLSIDDRSVNNANDLPNNTFLVTVTEKRTQAEIDSVINALKEIEVREIK